MSKLKLNDLQFNEKKKGGFLNQMKTIKLLWDRWVTHEKQVQDG